MVISVADPVLSLPAPDDPGTPVLRGGAWVMTDELASEVEVATEEDPAADEEATGEEPAGEDEAAGTEELGVNNGVG